MALIQKSRLRSQFIIGLKHSLGSTNMMAFLKKDNSIRQFRLGQNAIQLILVGLLTLILSLSFPLAVPSQIPSLPSTEKELVNNRRQLSGQIGNLLYAPIKIDGRPIGLIAVPSSAKNESSDNKSPSPLQTRVERIENKVKEIIERGFDPSTLQVFTSTLHGQTVISVSDQKNLKPQIIATITEPDAELYGQNVDDIANESTEVIRLALIRAWEERQPSSLQRQGLFAFKFFLGLLAISLIFILLERIVLGRIKYLKKFLLDLQNQTHTPPLSHNLQLFAKNHNLIHSIGDRVDLIFYWFYWIIFKRRSQTPNKYTNKPQDNGELPHNLNELLEDPSRSLNLDKLKSFLIHRINILVFLRRLLTFFQLFIWSRGFAFILTLFPYTRNFGILFAGVPASLLTIWLLIFLAIKIVELIIDTSLRAWLDDLGFTQQKSTRQTFRIPTISSSIKGVSFVFFICAGIFSSLAIFNVPISTVLAGAGILGFAVSFGSQSLIKDLISGVINLVNDAYAVGDFVIIGEDDGLVENMNLFVTRIRSANGDLITIPNGSVGTVRNQSKDWSRVDYKIQVSYETNISKALEIMLAIAEELCTDPHWSAYILDSPDLKGVEDLSHQGVLIRLWLKTKPGEQWMVGRELRLRMKEAFEKAGINIGIPQQAFLWQNSPELNQNTIPISEND
jgi:small-conductance mechanosensitive channel